MNGKAVNGGRQHEKDGFELEALGGGGMDVFWQEPFDLAAGGFDLFAVGGEQISKPAGSGPRGVLLAEG